MKFTCFVYLPQNLHLIYDSGPFFGVGSNPNDQRPYPTSDQGYGPTPPSRGQVSLQSGTCSFFSLSWSLRRPSP